MSQQTIRMLLIDDRSLTTDLDRAGYRKMGVTVKHAQRFDECMAEVLNGHVDIIVMNMDYTKVDSIQATKHIKSLPDHKTIPIVLTSVQTAAKLKNGAIKAGADLYVEQPLPRQYFIEKVKTLLDQKTRTTERIAALDSKVEFKINGAIHECDIGDLSISGMLLATEMTIPDGTNLEMTFRLDSQSKPIMVSGQVVRTIRAKGPGRLTGIGVRFSEFKGDGQRRLEVFVAKTTASDNKMAYYL